MNARPASSAPLSSAFDSLTRDNFIDYAKIKAGDDPLKQLMVRMCAGNPNCTGVAFKSSESGFGDSDSSGSQSSGSQSSGSQSSGSNSSGSQSSGSQSSGSQVDFTPLVQAISDLSKKVNTPERSEFYNLSNEDLKFKSKPVTISLIDGAPAQTISPREAEFNKNANDAIYRNEQNNDKYDDSDLPESPFAFDFLPFKGISEAMSSASSHFSSVSGIPNDLLSSAGSVENSNLQRIKGVS